MSVHQHSTSLDLCRQPTQQELCLKVLDAYSRKRKLFVGKICVNSLQIALSIKGTSTYIELIKDNKNLLKRISDIQIRTLINKIVENKTKSNRFFTLLSSMCACFGKSVSRNQNMIARMILDNNDALIMLKLSNEDSLTDRLSATSFLTRSNLFSPRVRTRKILV